MGIMAWRSTALSVAATVASDMPNRVRRSECPTITYRVPSRASMRGLTSPVRAPASSSEQCWAPSCERDGLLLDQRLDGAQVGERRVDRDVHRRDILGLEPQSEIAHHVQRLYVIVVHLPVPADQRAPNGHYCGAFGRVAQRIECGQVSARAR